ncbi:FRG domain-containing protein [Paenibacillus oryzisoli]|uniref:FRG domain-containing protein n=1 Tax=Paenibacillus oryzisoli TaxID=1850517 RepID=A0A198AHD8_9BACL|nr:FRG domain-containing protein [Paenibacillus oryzisoli]OAS20461.1 hypothetical protein A8708_17950 [Paenibacillus oryzisoli]
MITDFQKLAREGLSDGVTHMKIESWSEFNRLIFDELLDFTNYVWRGQRSASWLLESTITRKFKNHTEDKGELLKKHLENFKYATRGRRGSNPDTLKDNTDWWALGQHHGLATPLLDWSISPYVAAFFAFAEERDDNDSNEGRAIFALEKDDVGEKSRQLKGAEKIQFIKPFADDNPRLVNQSGLFTYGPLEIDLETLVKGYFKGENSHTKLIKIIIPESERSTILKGLNRMNINHSTLFPDLTGASLFSNMSLSVKNYGSLE